jgi:S1-C subfamily serine protease
MIRHPISPASLLVLTILSIAAPVLGSDPLDAVVRVTATIPAQARTAASLGTEREGNGILIDRKGHILTIGYLILEASRTQVTTAGGKTFQARFAGYDHATGFGLLQTIPPIQGEPIALGDSAAVSVGDTVQILTAGELAGSTARVLSRKAFVGYWEYLLENSIYVAPANPDYGGAALIADDGRLVGIGSILTRMELEGVGWIPCNMFVPIDLLKPILAELVDSGEAGGSPKPWLGIHSEEVQGRVFVLRVSEEGPSAAAGLKPGDVILSVGGEAVEGLADFYRKLWSMGDAGTRVPLRVLQGDQVQDIVVESKDRRQYLLPAGKDIGDSI